MSYLKDLPCAGCGTEITYYFPDKPTAHYCYCEFRHEIGEQIAREIEICEPCFNDVWCGKDEKNQDCSCICHQYAAIARGEPNQVTKDAIEEARKMNDLR